MTIFLCLYPPSMVTVYLRLSIEEACIKAHTLSPHMGMVCVGLICSFTFQSEMVVLRCKVSLCHQYHYVPTNPINIYLMRQRESDGESGTESGTERVTDTVQLHQLNKRR